MLRVLGLFICLFLMTTAAFATITLNVTSPTDGAFVGTTNSITFQVKQATLQVTVTAVVKNVATNGTTTITQKFTPDTDGNISGTLPLNFSQSSPEGAYTIDVSATEAGSAPVTFPTIHVTVDVTKPKIFEFNPLDGSFVNG